MPDTDPRIEIVTPKATDKFAISETAAMPVIEAQVRIVGVAPDPTPKTVFKWTATIEFSAATCANGPARKITHTPVLQSQAGGKFSPKFVEVRGGILTLTVEAQVSGQTLKTSVTGIRIVGTNPSKHAVAQAFPNKTIRQIASNESEMRQFESNGLCPLWSGDKLGGVGMMQITNPKPTDDEVWSWSANMTRGEKILKEKETVSKAYPGKVRNSAGFQTLVTKFNQARQKAGKPALTVTLAEFTAEQLRLDSIRGYNGFAGTDGLGNVLHEFRVPVDANGTLVVTERPDGKTAVIAWQQVPETARPKNGAYVRHVTSREV